MNIGLKLKLRQSKKKYTFIGIKSSLCLFQIKIYRSLDCKKSILNVFFKSKLNSFLILSDSPRQISTSKTFSALLYFIVSIFYDPVIM